MPILYTYNICNYIAHAQMQQSHDNTEDNQLLIKEKHWLGQILFYFWPAISTAILLFCTSTLDVYTRRVSTCFKSSSGSA
jgi:hypothetical protein